MSAGSHTASLFGLEPRHPMPDSWTPLEAVAVVKCLDEGGEVTLWLTSTDGLNSWECIGMLTASLDTSRSELQRGFEPEEPEE